MCTNIYNRFEATRLNKKSGKMLSTRVDDKCWGTDVSWRGRLLPSALFRTACLFSLQCEHKIILLFAFRHFCEIMAVEGCLQQCVASDMWDNMGLSGGKSEMLTIARRLLFSEGRGRGAGGGSKDNICASPCLPNDNTLWNFHILVCTCWFSVLSPQVWG